MRIETPGTYMPGSPSAAFEEIRKRWPQNPWGHQALADLSEACGHTAAARRHQDDADHAARG